jgi:hypothetical protein
MLATSFIRIADAGVAALKGRLGRTLQRLWEDEKSVVETKNWVTCLMRERGKIVPGSRREGCNVWTNTGREYVAMFMSLQADGTPYRSDRLTLIGVGTGALVEEPNVSALANPIAYAGSNFLAPLDVTATSFPLLPTRTMVRYSRVFSEIELTVPDQGLTSVLISELGLFTNGNQSTFAIGASPTGRDISVDNASRQSPVAYKNLGEPVEKTQGLEFEVSWEVRL